MICVDNQPYSILEDIGFQRFMQSACPQYELPSRRFIKEEYVEKKIYDVMNSKMQALFANVPFVSLTSDIWTEDFNGNSFISLTCHWLTEDFYQQHLVLKVAPFNESHSGMNISEMLLEGLQQFLITRSQVHMVLRDAASNIKLGVDCADLPGFDCFLHKLSTIVTETVYTQRTVIRH